MFGKGAPEGLLASETGNNAAVPGAIIPILTLAVPGSAPAAVLLAAMFIHGIRPGPLIMIEAPAFVFQVVAMVFMATVAMLDLRAFADTAASARALGAARKADAGHLRSVHDRLLRHRRADLRHLGHALLRHCRLFASREMDYPMAPLVLGIVLGPLLDKSFRRGMVLFDGDFTGFLDTADRGHHGAGLPRHDPRLGALRPRSRLPAGFRRVFGKAKATT